MKRFLCACAAALVLAACAKVEVDPFVPGGDDDDPSNPSGPVIDDSMDGYFAYGVAEITVTTDGKAAVDSKENYVPCTVKVAGCGLCDDFEARGRIRGRGNSTWSWYAKKPYRIKLDESAEFLGLPSNRDWVLLADYRDVTHMMNNVGFTLSKFLGIPYSNHIRYASVTLNGKDIGLYAVTEQVEEGGHRVQLDPETGLLLALDVNDGPGDVPGATDNFYSDVFRTDVCVKYPRDAGSAEVAVARKAFAELEQAIDDMDWERIQELLDIDSMVSYIMVQEIICNVEMNNGSSVRSGYINRYSDSSKWFMGPMWDCDGGFCYNWGDMYDASGWGHTYFEDYRRLIFGTDPYNERGAYGGFPRYFANLFGIDEFVTAFKDKWNSSKDEMLEVLLDNLEATEDAILDAAEDDLSLWKIRNYDHADEYAKLVKWLEKRFDYLDDVFNDYPGGSGSGTGSGGKTAEVKVEKTVSLSASYAQDGHHAGTTITLGAADVNTLTGTLGVSLEEMAWSEDVVFCHQEDDGKFTYDTTASDSSGEGFWYAADGAVCSYGAGSVFVEFSAWTGSALFTLGKHPTNCVPGSYKVNFVIANSKTGAAVRFDFDITVTSL